MKLKVPVNSYDSAVSQIEAGANEIYLGLEDEHFQRMSYSARAQVTGKGKRSNLEIGEFEKVVKYAHSRDVKIDFTVNCQHVSKSKDDSYRKGYLEYVKRGIELGVDALIVSDIGNLISLKKEKITTPIIAGSYFNVFNRESVQLLRELGVFRVVLPDQVTMEEIRSIKKETDLEVEIFIGYGCSNLGGSCNFFHNNGEKFDLGVPCRSNFKLKSCEITNILDACSDCAICSIPELCDIKIDSLKIIGRETDCNDVAITTRMYRYAIDRYQETGTFERDKVLSMMPWWKDVMCSKRCKYQTNRLLQTYI